MTQQNNQNLTERAEEGSHLPPVIRDQLKEQLEHIQEYRRNFEAASTQILAGYDKLIASYDQMIVDIDGVLGILGER